MSSNCLKVVNHSDDTDVHEISPEPEEISVFMEEPLEWTGSGVDQTTVNRLVVDMLTSTANYSEDDDDSPPFLAMLHHLAEKEPGWIQIVLSMIKVIPINSPLGSSIIAIIFEDCPLPSKDSIMTITKLLRLSKKRALASNLNIERECNICVALGCIADKLVGPNSVAVLSDDTLDYFITFLVVRPEPNLVLFVLIALEKFANSAENKLRIERRLNAESVNPLLNFEMMSDSDDYVWRQVGFFSKWILDNLFVYDGRQLSYLTIDMSRINTILNTKDVSKYLKISHNGLEARCDTYSFGSVRSTFQVTDGCWYYECLVVTPGVMQIGWASKNSVFPNHDGYGIGDDLFSLSYDGSRRLIWYNGISTDVTDIPKWKPGDILGCLIDLRKQEVVFSLNGKCLPPLFEIFGFVRTGFFAAATFMAFQQCCFNFGNEPFKFPPTDRHYSKFNDYGVLCKEEKMVIPRRIYFEKLKSDKNDSIKVDCCNICYDNTATCILEPCCHRGFCSRCTAMLEECPLCRGKIRRVRNDCDMNPSPYGSDSVGNSLTTSLPTFK